MIHTEFEAGIDALSTDAGCVFELPQSAILPTQTHTARVVNVDAAEGADLQGVDGVVTTRRGVWIGVRTADCLPLLLADREAGVIGAVHCGWRGTVAGIAAEAVRVMVAAGAQAERIVAVTGPHICLECFEVGEEVAAQFEPEAVERHPGWARPHVSLGKAVERQLRRAGVHTVHHCGVCSKESENFRSVRRQGRDLAERTLTLIRIN